VREQSGMTAGLAGWDRSGLGKVRVPTVGPGTDRPGHADGQRETRVDRLGGTRGLPRRAQSGGGSRGCERRRGGGTSERDEQAARTSSFGNERHDTAAAAAGALDPGHLHYFRSQLLRHGDPSAAMLRSPLRQPGMGQGQSRSSAHGQPRRRGYALPIDPSRTGAARTRSSGRALMRTRPVRRLYRRRKPVQDTATSTRAMAVARVVA